MSLSNKVPPCMKGMALVKVQNRTYRVPKSSLDHVKMANEQQPEQQQDKDSIYSEFVTEYYKVNQSYLGFLIGKGGSRLKQLKIETGTRIDIRDLDGAVMIRGTQDKVDKAKEMIDDVINKMIQTARPTHFVSLPIASPYALRKMTDFTSSILSSSFRCPGMDPSIVVSPANLHITLGVCKLQGGELVDSALQCIKSQLPTIVASTLTKPLSLQLSGLKIMDSDPAKAHVLYIEPHDVHGNGLQTLCDAVVKELVEQGIVVKDDRPFKPHVTLINTAHRTKDQQKEPNSRIPFDARPILAAYGDVDFGLAHIDKLHLMKMGRSGPNGTYLSLGSIPLSISSQQG